MTLRLESTEVTGGDKEPVGAAYLAFALVGGGLPGTGVPEQIEGRRIRLVDRDVAARLLNLPKRLPNAGGFPGLTRTEDGDDPAGHPGEPTKQRVDLGALKRIHLMNMRS